MRAQALARLVRLSLKRDRRGAASSVFGIAVGVASLVFFVALGMGVAQVVREKIFPVDASLVEVVPAQLSLGLLGGGRIDQSAVDRLAALPGVEHAWRKMNLRVPASSFYDGDFFGHGVRMGVDVIAVGVDPELVKKDLLLGDFSDPPVGKPIPAVLAARLLEIYNKSFAPARSLPQLSATMLAGFIAPLQLNRSFIVAAPPGPVTAAQVQVVGFSERGLLAGITIPLDTARRLNRAYNVDAEAFSAVTLKLQAPEQVPQVVVAVKAMGLRVDDQERRLAENTGAAVAITTVALALLSLLICVLAAFNIAHALSASVRSREKELGVMRAVGASRLDVFSLVLAEAACLGAVGGLLGTALAVGAALGLDAAAAHWIADFPFKPQSFFSLSPWLAAAGLGLGLLSATVGAWLPARRAARLDPARTLAGQTP